MSGAEIRTGAWMIRGTIVSLKPIRLLPTFSYANAYNPVFLNLYVKQLDSLGYSLPSAGKAGIFHRHIGDASVPGKGEILVWQPADCAQ